MAYESLSDYLGDLQDDGELRRIAVEVDPVLELTEVTDRVAHRIAGGPALCFQQVRGSSFPLVVNMMGSEKRLCRVLGVTTFAELTERIRKLLKPDLSENWLQKFKLVPQAAQMTPLLPQSVKSGVSQQVVKVGRDVDLRELPALQHWPNEGGRTLSPAQVWTRDPATGVVSVDTFPLQIRDRGLLAAHWHVHHAACRLFREYQRQGTSMPIAIVFGGDPVLDLLGRLPAPPNVEPLVFAGWLRGKGIETVRCRQIDLEIPARAELVIEGNINGVEGAEMAGPFAETSGYYGPAAPSPLVQVVAMTHRSSPMLTATIPARSPSEDDWIRTAGEQITLPVLQQIVPDVCNITFPQIAGGRLAIVQLEKRYAHQAKTVFHAVWSLPATKFAKLVIVVGPDVNIHDMNQVWFAVGMHVHPGRDTLIAPGPSAADDHASPVSGCGERLGLDATRKLPEEGHPRPWPEALSMPSDVRELVDRRWGEYQLGPNLGSRM